MNMILSLLSELPVTAAAVVAFVVAEIPGTGASAPLLTGVLVLTGVTAKAIKARKA